jgi:hypothetical protein
MSYIPGPRKDPVLNARAAERERNLEAILREKDQAEGAPPPIHPADRSWRYRKDGAPNVFALAGVVVGFALLIVPGIFALRSYRRWQVGASPEPTLAWSIAALTVLVPFVVAAYLALPAFGILLGCVGVPAALYLVRPTT